MATSELDFFEALDSESKADQNQWPEFALKNVKVVSKDSGQLTSLLAAHRGSLLRVEGQVNDVDPEYIHRVKIAKYRKRSIVVDDVALYSFSQYDDGSFGFWAAGRAGWYEISSPAPKYRRIFESMSEATGMFYYLADKYKNSRSKMLKESARVRDNHVKYLMNDYAHSDFCTRQDNEDIREGFYEHRYFLMKSMLEGQEGLDWENSPILRHFKKQFPGDFKAMQSVVLGDATAKAKQDEDSEVEEVVIPHNRKQSKRRSNSGKGRKVSLPVEDVTMDEEEEEILDSGMVTPPRRGKRKSHLRPKSERSAKRFTRFDLRTTRSTDTGAEDVDMRDGTEDETNDSIPDAIPAGSEHAALAEAIAPALDAELTSQNTPMPSYYEARGPADTWVCPYDGCNHKVWDAKNPRAIELMRTHFTDTHANNMEDLINSESRPWAGVSHLLQRVKGIAAAKAESESNTMKVKNLPERVLRRY